MSNGKEKQTRQLNCRILKQLHQDFTIFCLKKGITKEQMLEKIVRELLNKEKNKKTGQG